MFSKVQPKRERIRAALHVSQAGFGEEIWVWAASSLVLSAHHQLTALPTSRLSGHWPFQKPTWAGEISVIHTLALLLGLLTFCPAIFQAEKLSSLAIPWICFPIYGYFAGIWQCWECIVIFMLCYFHIFSPKSNVVHLYFSLGKIMGNFSMSLDRLYC